MSERLRRSRRVLAVQSQLDRLAEWRLIELQSLASALGDKQRDLIGLLSGESGISGIFSGMILRRLQTVEEMLVTVANAQQTQSGCHQNERRRLRCAERIVANLESEERRTDALCQLAEVIEAALQRRS